MYRLNKKGFLLGLSFILTVTSSGFCLKYYYEWMGKEDWDEVRPYSNLVGIGVGDTVAISSAIAKGFKVMIRGNGESEPANMDGAINAFYDFVTPYSSHVVISYWWDEPPYSVADGIKQFMDRYKLEGERRGINIPATISYAGASMATMLPDSMGIPGMFTYFDPTTRDADDAQRAKYENVVHTDINMLKQLAGTRPIMVIGQSFDEGTGMPTVAQQQWYVDDARNDPQILHFWWFNYLETKKYPDLVAAHRTFGAQLVNIGVHNVSLVVTESSATVKWQTNLPCESGIVEYGATTGYGSTVQDVNPSSPDVHVAYITNLTPGQVIYYKITSKATGYTEGPYASWFGVGIGTLTGTIRDEENKPISTAKITVNPGKFYSISTSTGGYAIDNIPPGNYKVTVESLPHRVYATTTIKNSTTTVLDFNITLIPAFSNGDFETGNLNGWTVYDGFALGDVRSDGNFSTPSHGGKYFLGHIVSKGVASGRAFQIFKSTAGHYVTASAYIFTDAWTGSPDAGFPNDNYGRIGLDPTGGKNPYASSVVWSEHGKPFQKYGLISVSTRAVTNKMTIFIELVQTQNHEWNKTGIDDIVVRQSPTPEMDTTPPANVPQLFVPDNNATFNTLPIYFDWTDVADVNSQSPPVFYDLQIDDESSFSPPVLIDKPGLNVSQFTTTSTLAVGTYYWHVRAKDSASPPNAGSWSITRTLKLNTTGVYTLIMNNSGFESGLENWTDYQPVGYTWYTIDGKVAHTGTKSAQIQAIPPYTSQNPTGDGHFWQFTDSNSVTPGLNYKFWVWVKNEGSVFQPGGRGPAIRVRWIDNSTNQTYGESWSGVSPSGNADWTKIEFTTQAPTGAQRAQVALFYDYGRGTVWFDNVNTEVNIDTTPPTIPTLVAPTKNSTLTTARPNFDWSDVTDFNNLNPPVYYDLLVDNNALFTSPEIEISSITVSQYTPPLPLNNGTYYWRIRAFDSATNVNYSNWSDIGTFVISVEVVTPNPMSELKPGEVRTVISKPAKPGVVSPSKGETVRMHFKNKVTDTTGGEYKLRVLDVAGNIVYEDIKVTTNTQDEFTWQPDTRLPPGVYITYIEGPGVKSYDKLIIGK